MKKEHPILFSTAMVQAIFAGRKTQTRRIIKSRHESGLFQVCRRKDGTFDSINSLDWDERNCEKDVKCPYGTIGDILWVKETFYAYGKWNENGKTKSGKQKYIFNDLTGTDFNYRYFNNPPERIQKGRSKTIGWYKRPSLFMPKTACRIWLEITDVRVERVHYITKPDAVAEGINCDPDGENPIKSFETLWKSINGKESWDANPWVWVVSFKVLSTTGKPEILNSVEDVNQ